MLPRAGAPALDPDLLLEAVTNAPNAWDDAWRAAIVDALRSPELRRAQAGLRAVAAHRKRDFAPALQEVGRDASRPTAFRVAALQLAAGADSTLDATSFGMLLEPLAKGGAPDARLQAATVLAGAKLTRAQLFELLNVVPLTGPMELQQVLGAFQRGPADPEVGAQLLAQLKESPGRWGVMQTTLQTIFQRYPAPAYENAAPLIAEIMNQNVAKDGRVAELETLATGGNPAAGRAAFLAGAGACLTCHRVGDTGGTMGPDLSHIGRIRSKRDLLEAVAFPNASIARGYESFQVTTQDGNSLVGTIPREAADTVFVVTADGHEHPVPRATIAKLEPVPMSLMPPGLDRALEQKALADLVAFLQSLD
ncbi:MAG: c-type cytochrome [Verrucomicrobia bacterium]|nr:c-type cytochrome [Verrucomicrobiota bacterium]